MSDWLKALNPTSTITNEADAERAARASAVSIFIGVVAGVISLIWTATHPAVLQDAMTQAAGGDAEAAAGMAAAGQIALYVAGMLVLVQLIFGIVQWRNPEIFIAILFMVLIAYGLISGLATPFLAGAMPNIPHVPVWQIALSVAVLIVQMVLQVAGLRGIRRLDGIQMEQAR